MEKALRGQYRGYLIILGQVLFDDDKFISWDAELARLLTTYLHKKTSDSMPWEKNLFQDFDDITESILQADSGDRIHRIVYRNATAMGVTFIRPAPRVSPHPRSFFSKQIFQNNIIAIKSRGTDFYSPHHMR